MNRIRGWPISLEEGPVGLRPLRLRDAAAMRDTRVRNADWLRPWEPTHPEMPLQTTNIAPYLAMAQAIRREGRQGVAMPWAITYEGGFAGQLTVGAIVWGSARSAQIGYWIDKERAGLGVTPTAVALAVDHCFFTAGLHRIEANIRPENRASRRVAEKLGFREEGVRRRQLHIDGAWRDHICYALTVEDVPRGLLPRWREQRRGRDLGGGPPRGGAGSSGAASPPSELP
ncbi:ribosomal-protein-alanine N-acetyltransferase [Spinactinospora alkalitolerans]|uniref:Ribosomal-protein-alanine N-acetyltransferase n=1 Tax=Spinactinospora alkalitolerans TaxID=687207 RepID=A0A852TTQ7_9ACTN|nr:GNAT family protein [Spinactinospora alkalitolerans]NYE45504.1 ribosomal-protein-alanine N-acetyltransferase [Spinactinospora alkalitolerans]